MRVWDISPSYLNRPSLLGEHSEIHGLYTILTQGRRGFGNHPETQRWRGHLAALVFRHQQVVSEMLLRGYRHVTPLICEAPLEWPTVYLNPPGEQYSLLAGRYAGREPGRLPMPANVARLWEQHCLSVLARGAETYARLEASIHGCPAISLSDLATQLVVILRTPPSVEGTRASLRALLGHDERGLSVLGAASLEAVCELLEGLGPLKAGAEPIRSSTAPADLHAWCQWQRRRQY